MNSLNEVEGVLTCSCGAKAEPKDKGRFKRRHPALCTAKGSKIEFTKQLEKKNTPDAQAQKILAEADTDVTHQIEAIRGEGRGLNSWEIIFMDSIEEQLTRDKSLGLSEKQIKSLDKIYRTRVTV